MSYTIEGHSHRLAAWAASRAASVKGCRFKVHKGVAVLEASGFGSAFSLADLPKPALIDDEHRKWRTAVIAAAKKEKLVFTDGISAKLINCYMKVKFVCGGHHADERVSALHPPIDRLLLGNLSKIDFEGHGNQWRKFCEQGWSKFDSDTYEEVIKLIRSTLPKNEPLWKIEEYWEGYQ
jgi:hypothetical protein